MFLGRKSGYDAAPDLFGEGIENLELVGFKCGMHVRQSLLDYPGGDENSTRFQPISNRWGQLDDRIGDNVGDHDVALPGDMVEFVHLVNGDDRIRAAASDVFARDLS